VRCRAIIHYPRSAYKEIGVSTCNTGHVTRMEPATNRLGVVVVRGAGRAFCSGIDVRQGDTAVDCRCA